MSCVLGCVYGIGDALARYCLLLIAAICPGGGPDAEEYA